MLSDNWVVQNLENALETWNNKLAEIWQLITQSPQQFKGGTIWNVIVNIHGAVQAIGLALLVLFFVVGVMKTMGSFAELKKPEHALKVFIRFALAKAAVTYGLELMMALFNIVQGLISTIMTAAGFGAAGQTVLPSEIVTAVEDCGFFESISIGRIPIWRRQAIGTMILLFSHSPSVEAFFVRDPSQAMRAADREPAGGEIPVELTSRQPFDDFPQQSGVSRTNRIVSLYKVKRQDGSIETENVYIFPTLILFCL